MTKIYKKILPTIILLSVAAFLILPAIASAEAPRKMYSKCYSNADNPTCATNDCEKSTLNDKNSGAALWFCDCKNGDSNSDGNNDDCFNFVGGPPADGGTWTCKDGSVATYDVDYCISVKANGDNGTDKRGMPPFIGNPGIIDAVFDQQAMQAGLLEEVKTLKPTPRINIPGLKYSDLNSQLDEQGNLYIPFIGEFLKAAYNFGLAIVSIVAVVMIIIQGTKMVASAGAEKADSFKKIGQIVVGLVIAWGSYAILYNINPDLVKFKALKIKYVEPIPLSDLVFTSDSTGEPIDQRNSDLAGTAQPFGSTAFDDIFKKYSSCVGVNWEVYKLIAHHESGLNPSAKNPHSSATGLFQDMAGKDNRTCKKVLDNIGLADKCTNPGLTDPETNTAYVTLIFQASASVIKSKCAQANIVDQLALFYHAHSSGPGATAEGIRLYGCKIDDWPDSTWPAGTKYKLPGVKIFNGATKAYVKKFADKATQYNISQFTGAKNTNSCPIEI